MNIDILERGKRVQSTAYTPAQNVPARAQLADSLQNFLMCLGNMPIPIKIRGQRDITELGEHHGSLPCVLPETWTLGNHQHTTEWPARPAWDRKETFCLDVPGCIAQSFLLRHHCSVVREVQWNCAQSLR